MKTLLIVFLVIMYTATISARPAAKANRGAKFTCASLCDGIYQMCDRNVEHTKRIKDSSKLSEQLLCINLRIDCMSKCIKKTGMFN